MRDIFCALSMEDHISLSLQLQGQLAGKTLTPDEAAHLVPIAKHLREAAEHTRLLVNSLIQRSQSGDVHDLVDYIEKRRKPAQTLPTSGDEVVA